jgi:hypothetical protein
VSLVFFTELLIFSSIEELHLIADVFDFNEPSIIGLCVEKLRGIAQFVIDRRDFAGYRSIDIGNCFYRFNTAKT